jgi:hypothetical protein
VDVPPWSYDPGVVAGTAMSPSDLRCLYDEWTGPRGPGMGKVDVVTADLISRALPGDGDAFRALTEPYRRELHVHFYRMLGSHRTRRMLCRTPWWPPGTAWADSASRHIRTWLYRIATNKCLNALRGARRRPAKAWDIPGVEPPEPTRLGKAVWLGAFPYSLLDGVFDLMFTRQVWIWLIPRFNFSARSRPDRGI